MQRRLSELIAADYPGVHESHNQYLHRLGFNVVYACAIGHAYIGLVGDAVEAAVQRAMSTDRDFAFYCKHVPQLEYSVLPYEGMPKDVEECIHDYEVGWNHVEKPSLFFVINRLHALHNWSKIQIATWIAEDLHL